MPAKTHQMVLKVHFSEPVSAGEARLQVHEAFGSAMHFTSNGCPAPTFRISAKPKPVPRPNRGSQNTAMLDDLQRVLNLISEAEGAHDYAIECLEDAESYLRRMIRRLENGS